MCNDPLPFRRAAICGTTRKNRARKERPRPTKRYQDRPATVGTITGCPYRSLIAGILERAVQDARGRCNPVPSRTRAAQLQDEARAWLTTSRDVEVLLELGGYESAVILQRVQQVLGG